MGGSAPRWVDARALLEEGEHRLASVGCHGAGRHGLAGARVGGLEVQIDRVVEGVLAERLRGDATAARGARERLGLLREPRARDDAVDEPPGERGAGIDGIAGERQLERALAPDRARHRDHRRVAEPAALAARGGEARLVGRDREVAGGDELATGGGGEAVHARYDRLDRKSTRLNSSHRCISYAVFCLIKTKET